MLIKFIHIINCFNITPCNKIATILINFYTQSETIMSLIDSTFSFMTKATHELSYYTQISSLFMLMELLTPTVYGVIKESDRTFWINGLGKQMPKCIKCGIVDDTFETMQHRYNCEYAVIDTQYKL